MAVQRRLAAILAADVAGYSRLMGEDEEGTLAALTAHLKELIDPCIAEHRGRVVKTTGDGLLAEFASVVDAVAQPLPNGPLSRTQKHPTWVRMRRVAQPKPPDREEWPRFRSLLDRATVFSGWEDSSGNLGSVESGTMAREE